MKDRIDQEFAQVSKDLRAKSGHAEQPKDTRHPSEMELAGVPFRTPGPQDAGTRKIRKTKGVDPHADTQVRKKPIEEEEVEESSAGIPRGFGIDPAFAGPQGKATKRPKQHFPMLGGTYLSLAVRPHEIVVDDFRKGVVYYHDKNDDGTHLSMPAEKFLKTYEGAQSGLGESYRMGDIGAYIDPEHGDAGQNVELVPHVIDLGSSRRGDLDESFLQMFGNSVKSIMQRMFGGSTMPVTVKGTRSEIDAFSTAIGRERDYMKAYQEFGLDNPQTYRSKFKLDTAVRRFERKTNLKWPFSE
jgi:hypothetical protein